MPRKVYYILNIVGNSRNSGSCFSEEYWLLFKYAAKFLADSLKLMEAYFFLFFIEG